MTSLFINRNLHSSDMNGLVQKALDASNVYENIISYVNEANETAEVALNITDRIYDAVSGIDTQVIYHKDESENLFNQARELQTRANSSKYFHFPILLLIYSCCPLSYSISVHRDSKILGLKNK